MSSVHFDIFGKALIYQGSYGPELYLGRLEKINGNITFTSHEGHSGRLEDEIDGKIYRFYQLSDDIFLEMLVLSIDLTFIYVLTREEGRKAYKELQL